MRWRTIGTRRSKLAVTGTTPNLSSCHACSRRSRRLSALVDLVARVPVSVQIKLLAGFLFGTALLLVVGLTSAVLISRLNERASIYMTAGQIRLKTGLVMENESRFGPGIGL